MPLALAETTAQVERYQAETDAACNAVAALLIADARAVQSTARR